MGLNGLLDQPFRGADVPPAQGSTASVLSPDVPYFAQMAINGHNYMVDLTKYERTTLAAQRQPVDQSMEPGEQTLNTEGLWRRSQENWVLGAGQYYLDNIASLYSLYERAGENQSLRFRFWCSKNVDIWTSGQMTLLPLSEQKYTSTSTSIMCMAIGDYLYVADGEVVKFTSNPTALSPTWSTYTFQTGTADDITSWTTDGTSIYAACGTNGVWQIPAAGATTGAAQLGTVTPDFVVYGNGRLVIGTGPDLDELNLDGTTTSIGSHKNPDWFWTSGCSAPNAIYLAGSAGGQVGEIYSVSITSGGTALAPPTVAAPLPVGELANCLVFSGGYICIGTTVGFRLADISSATSNGLTFGPVIEIANGVNALAAWGEFVYFTWSKMSVPGPLTPTTNVQSTGVGRADLGRFTSALVPAYTSDLQIDDANTAHTDWTASAVAMFDGQPYWTATDGTSAQSTVNGPNATKYAASGMFQSGWTRYNTVEGKVVASIDYHHDALAGSVGAFLVLEDQSTFITLPESNTPGSLGPTSPYSTNYQAGEAFNTHVYLIPDAAETAGPVLRRYTIRALIAPYRMEEIILPIIMRTRVEGIAGDGSDWWQDTLTEWQFLRGLQKTIVTYQEGSQTYPVYIDRIQVKPQKWRDDRGFFEGEVICRLVTIPVD